MAKNEPNSKTPNSIKSKKGFRIPFLPKTLDEPCEIRAKVKKELGEFQRTFIKEISNLIISAFGLLAALAWRGVIQEFVDTYIKKFFGETSGLVSELFFALFITLLAVLVAWRLTKIKQRLFTEETEEE